MSAFALSLRPSRFLLHIGFIPFPRSITHVAFGMAIVGICCPSFLFGLFVFRSLSLSLIRYLCLGAFVRLSLSFFLTFSLSVSHSDLILTFSKPATPHQMLYGLGILPITADTWWPCPIVPDYRSSWTPFSPGSRQPSPFCACRPPGAEPCWGLEVPCCLSHTPFTVRS